MQILADRDTRTVEEIKREFDVQVSKMSDWRPELYVVYTGDRYVSRVTDIWVNDRGTYSMLLGNGVVREAKGTDTPFYKER